MMGVHPGNLSIEEKALLECLRSCLGLAPSPAHCFANQSFRWAAFHRLARAHGVGMLVGRLLLQEDHLPKQLKDDTNAWVRSRTIRAEGLLHSQLQLAASWHRSGISAVWLKGLLLSQQLYDSIEARGSNDLDVLVKPEDQARAEAVLREEGYTKDMSPGFDEAPSYSHHSVWQREGGFPTTVELHVRLRGPASCQPIPQALVDRSRVMELQARRLRTLSLEDELLMLCLHAHQHSFCHLRCLVDVAAYARRHTSNIDWNLFCGTARSNGCLARSVAAFELVQRLFLVQSNQPRPRLAHVQQLTLRGLSVKDSLDHGRAESYLRTVRLLFLLDRWTDMIRYFLWYTWPPKGYVRATCPSSVKKWPVVPRLYHVYSLFAKLLRRH